MFAPLFGVPEDPATGAANVTLIGLLAHHDPRADLTLSKTIGQGFDMGRPSLLDAVAEKKAGKVVATYIGGRCVPMLSGTIEVYASPSGSPAPYSAASSCITASARVG